MSGRVVYLQRGDRGATLASVRVVGERADEAWSPPEPSADAPVLAQAARWVKERVPRSGESASAIDVLCIDSSSSLCSWLNAPSGDPALVAALARQGGDAWSGGADMGAENGTARADVLGNYAGAVHESTVQALSAPPGDRPARRVLPWRKPASEPVATPEPRRLSVLAVPDVSARLFLDALDAQHVRAHAVCSLWHAVAAAWDPTGMVYAQAVADRSPDAPDRVVAESASVRAVVIVEGRGLLHWTWTERGSLVAAGSMRLRTIVSTTGEPAAVRILKTDVARLTAEWLAWSVQLGIAPAHITSVVPGTMTSIEGSLEPAEFGAALNSAWPHTAVDLAVDPDPLGATLARLAAAATVAQDRGATALTFSAGDPRHSLVDLSHRPGRDHFRLHLWGALAVGVLSAGLGAWAWRLQQFASGATVAARQAAAERRESFGTLKLPGPIMPGTELMALRTEIAKREIDAKPVAIDEPAMPILQELETLSMVLGAEQVDISEISLDSRSGLGYRTRIVVDVPGIDVGEQLAAGLKGIAGSHLSGWSTPDFKTVGNSKIRATYTASWSPQASKPTTTTPTASAESPGGPS